MAKIGEGDPRWIVDRRQDGINVNNWHWKEKDCTKWGKERAKSLFKDVELVSQGENKCCITSIDKVTGDASSNVRKGKVLVLYDFTLEVSWKVSLPSLPNPITGKATIHFENDSDNEYTATTSENTATHKEWVNIIKNVAYPIFDSLVATWVKELKDQSPKLPSSGGEPSSTSSPSATPASKTSSSSSVNNNNTSSPSSNESSSQAKSKDTKPPAVKEKTTVSYSTQLRARSADVYACLLDSQRVSAFTRSSCSVSASPGSPISLFNGQVEGTILELDQDKRIIKHWRFKDWPGDCRSTVTITLTDNSNGCLLSLNQTDVPSNDYERTKTGWQRHYFDPMKQLFGWGNMGM